MPPVRERRSSARDSPTTSRRQPFLPILVLVALNIHTFGLGYFWDDFYFLTFQSKYSLHSLVLPDPHFFRPIPLGVYFKFLRLLDPVNGTVAHVLGLVWLAVAVLLLMRLVSGLSGPRAGLFAGLVFAGSAPVSSLATWVSTCTDLLALLFLAAALLLRHLGRNLAALACAGAALLCKETSVAAFPVLALWDRLVGRSPKRPWLIILGYVAVVTGWALIHPGIRGLAEHQLRSGSAEYVGVQPWPLWTRHLAQYLMMFLNLPPFGLTSSWEESRVVLALLAALIVLIGLMVLDRRWPAAQATPTTRVALLSALFCVPTAVMTAVLVRNWAPYLACIPVLGVSILAGTLLARQPRWVALGVLALFLILGARLRGIEGGTRESVLGEPLMLEASRAAKTVRANFREVLPSFPRGAQVVASVGTTGLRGIQGILFEGQALSVWYRDPTLRTLRIMDRSPRAAPEYLVRVTDALDVIAIDPLSGGVRSSALYAPDIAEWHPPLVNYARAVAAGGETDRAIQVIRNLSRMESGDFLARNNRIVASMLLAAGRDREADSLLAATRALSAEDSRQLVVSLVANASSSEKLDLASFRAFGLSESDPATVRWVMGELWNRGFSGKAAWFALRLQRLVPGDAEAASVLRARRGIEPSRR